jgi:deoxyribodipyrimidine photo-lyase
MLDTILVWFRRDLRLHDNETLWQAAQDAKQILPVYCFDPREFGASRLLELPRTGYFRSKFLLESLEDLQRSLSSLGSNLYIVCGKPEEQIPEILKQFPGQTAVYALEEFATEEIGVQKALANQLAKCGSQLKLFETTGLFKTKDLPFAVDRLPDVFTVFRQKLEKTLKVRPEFLSHNLKLPTAKLAEGSLPTIKSLASEAPITNLKPCLQFVGGETQALKRLNEYFWSKDLLRKYKQTRNGLIGPNYSSKFSAWLALGALSPVHIYHQVKRYEKERLANESTYWLIFELFWREYFRFSALKHGSRLFYKNGFIKNTKVFKQDKNLFKSWQSGQTGTDFVDANMSELALTGFMSNRGRQNVASYLCKTLGLDWRWGAEYFEMQLIDHDVYNNWGNWSYQAGVGHDPRDRTFNIERQAQTYDANGEYTNYWLERPTPQLKLF